MGGVEKKFIDVLKIFSDSAETIDVVIEEYPDDHINLLSDIPQRFTPVFVLNKEFMQKKECVRYKRHTHILYRLLYNYILQKQKIVARRILKQIMHENEYDVIIDFSNDFAYETCAAPKISWIHSSSEHNLKPSHKKKFEKRIRDSFRTICLGNEMMEQVTRIFPNISGNLVRIYNPFDCSTITSLAHDVSSLSDEEKQLLARDYILSVGRLDERQKDFSTLIKAFANIAPHRKEDLYVIGCGVDRHMLEKLVDEERLSERVKFLGVHKNPYVWMKHAKLYVHSSKFEGFPTVLIEALILKKPIIATQCMIGPYEILQGGKLGVLVNVGDVQQLADSMNMMLSDNNRQRKYIENITHADSWLTQFNPEFFRKEIEALIEDARKKHVKTATSASG